jgi:hypothetical protein
MTVPLVLCALVASADIPFPLLPTPGRDVDLRLQWLYKADVRKDKKRLAKVLDDIWKMLPEPSPAQEERKEEMAKHLVLFITLDAPADVRREGLVSGHTGVQIYNILLHIGLPAVPALLDHLQIPLPDTEDARVYRETVARCLVEIYGKGGDGRRMAVERIKLYAETHGYPAEKKKRILSALELTALKPSPPPVERRPGK